jgi:hypothetical protein
VDDEHIKLENRDGLAAVVIDDWELFDYLDDFLSERGLDYERLSEVQVAGRRIFTMHFAASVAVDQVSAILEQVPPSEIQRIWCLNND